MVELVKHYDTMAVVMASEGYPGHYKKKSPISGLDVLPEAK